MKTADRYGDAIGRALADLRGHRSQAEMSTLVGYSKSTIVNYETGRRLPELEFLAAFAEVTGADFLVLTRLCLASSHDERARRVALTLQAPVTKGVIASAEDAEGTLTPTQAGERKLWHKGVLQEVLAALLLAAQSTLKERGRGYSTNDFTPLAVAAYRRLDLPGDNYDALVTLRPEDVRGLVELELLLADRAKELGKSVAGGAGSPGQGEGGDRPTTDGPQLDKW